MGYKVYDNVTSGLIKVLFLIVCTGLQFSIKIERLLKNFKFRNKELFDDKRSNVTFFTTNYNQKF